MPPLVRVPRAATRASRSTSDCTPRYVQAHPETGGRQAVAEAWRNITATGATPLAVTDNMNFGNPQKPEIMGQFAGAIMGMAEACTRSTSRSCRATSRSTTRPRAGRSCRRRRSARVGVIEDISQGRRLAPDAGRPGDRADRRDRGLARPVAVPARTARPRGRRAAAGRSGGRAAQRRFRAQRRSPAGRVDACHDLSRRRLAGRPDRDVPGRRHGRHGPAASRTAVPSHAFFYGEDQARYLVATGPGDDVLEAARKAGVPAVRLGYSGGDVADRRGPGIDAAGRPQARPTKAGCPPIWMPRNKGN